MRNFATPLLPTAWTEEDRRQLDALIVFVEGYQGNNFTSDVCHYLYELLAIDYVLVGQACPQTQQIQTSFILAKGLQAPDFAYSVTSTPCAQVLSQGLYYIPFGVQSIFPDAGLLKNWQVASYLGIPLLNEQEQPAGLIALLHQRLIQRPGFVEALLNIIIPRLELELLPLPVTWDKHLSATCK